MAKNKLSFWKKWRLKYRLVVLSGETFEERFSFGVSKLGFFVFFCICNVFIMLVTALFISYSPLREFIPGYTSTNIRRQMVALNQLSDSLKTELIYKQHYVENIKNIIRGDSFNPEVSNTIRAAASTSLITTDRVLEDSLLRKNIEQEERFNFFSSTKTEKQGADDLLFFVPVSGIVTQSFVVEDNHYGVDVVTKENELIKSTLSGVVVFSSWTSETGHVIAIQHENGILSIYKHNAVLLKVQGEKVSAGEAIAIIGNSGKWSSGPHLHFELWHKNNPIDPEQFIKF